MLLYYYEYADESQIFDSHLRIYLDRIFI